jgi:hypothetical protein
MDSSPEPQDATYGPTEDGCTHFRTDTESGTAVTRRRRYRVSEPTNSEHSCGGAQDSAARFDRDSRGASGSVGWIRAGDEPDDNESGGTEIHGAPHPSAIVENPHETRVLLV